MMIKIMYIVDEKNNARPRKEPLFLAYKLENICPNLLRSIMYIQAQVAKSFFEFFILAN
jgi:hypothetical protein